jgi:PKD repeat protein
VDWGDGTVETAFDLFSDARADAVGRLRQAHTFAAPGTYDVVVTVVDDDGRVVTDTLPVDVLTAEEAIESVVGRIDELLLATIDVSVRSALQAARDELVGNVGGAAANGATDRLEDGDVVAAIVKLRAAVRHLIDAETAGAGDLSALKDLLALVAEALAVQALADATAATFPPTPGQATNKRTACSRSSSSTASTAGSSTSSKATPSHSSSTRRKGSWGSKRSPACSIARRTSGATEGDSRAPRCVNQDLESRRSTPCPVVRNIANIVARAGRPAVGSSGGGSRPSARSTSGCRRCRRRSSLACCGCWTCSMSRAACWGCPTRAGSGRGCASCVSACRTRSGGSRSSSR